MSLPTLSHLCAMATRQALAAMAPLAKAQGLAEVELTSLGGVDAAQPIAAGEGWRVHPQPDLLLTSRGP